MANSLRGQTTVTIGDDQFEVLLNMNAFRLMCQDRGMELQQMDDFLGKSPLDFVPSIVFWGIMNAADYKGDARLTSHSIASPPSCVLTWTNSLNCQGPSGRPSESR